MGILYGGETAGQFSLPSGEGEISKRQLSQNLLSFASSLVLNSIAYVS
jgi:hypothetical protein